ncbi:hypothetical protein, partial [Agrobacterium deltaense]|uniref:hypothetical protein n=1 Tax=Agrobacterium deltaense TaxID=1183412 RepID=UPI001ABFC256
KDTYQCPHISDLCLSEPVLQPMHFEEIERPTTNPTISPPFIARGYSSSNTECESDRLLPRPALAQREIEMSPGPSLNRDSIRSDKQGGDEREKKKAINNRTTQNSAHHKNIKLLK